MKKIKRFFACILAMTMGFLMTASAFASGETDGVITINEATVGDTYKLYLVFDATAQGEGDAKTVAYTYTKTGEEDALYDALVGTDSPFSLTETSAEGVCNVALKEGKTASDASLFFKANEEKLGESIWEKLATRTTVTFNYLTYGYYYISKGGDLPGASVGVTSVAPSQTIHDKSTKPGPFTPDPEYPDPEDPYNPGGYKVFADAEGKASAALENTANYGDIVHFILQAQAANYDEGQKIVEYTAYDMLGEGFQDFAITKVTVDGTEIGNYSSDLTASPATVTIPWIDAEGNHLYANTAVIKIYCQAVVGEQAVIGETGSNTVNVGWFNWKYDNLDENGEQEIGPNDPENPDKETDTVTTKVYAVAINKTDSKGNPLAGAYFELVREEDKVPVTLVSEGNAAEASIYKYDAESSNYTVVSPASGKILVKGLASGAYTLNETEAPNGYNLIDAGIVMEAEEFAASTMTLTLYKDGEGNLTDTETDTAVEITFDEAAAAVNVINLTGAELPSTGGAGTVMFYVIGGGLIVLAAVLLIVRKRMES